MLCVLKMLAECMDVASNFACLSGYIAGNLYALLFNLLDYLW